MPKGSKKRRAERRKKESGIQTPPNGIEDPKLNDEKEIMEDVNSYTTSTTTTGSSNQDLGQDEEENSKAGLVNTGESKEDEEVNQVLFTKDIKLEDHEEEKIVVIEGDYSDKNTRIIPIDSIKRSDFDSSSDGNNSSGSGDGSGSSSSAGNSSDEESLQITNPIDKKQHEIVTDSSLTQYDQIEQEEEEVISFLSQDVNPTAEASSAVKEAVVEESSLNDIQSKNMLPTSDDSITEISSGVDGNNQEIHDISDKQHQQVAPARPPLQPTSWKGCCGLFEVFMGSSR